MKKPTEKLFRALDVEIKAINQDAKTVTALVSTKKVDRDGDVILPEAFKSRLKHYKDHPVFLVNHSYRTEDTIGEATSVKITDDGLECTFKYYVGKGNPKADWAWQLAENGLAAFSVGFIGYEWEPITDKTTNYITGRTFTDVELIEVSQVAVPSNRGALQSSRSLAEAESKLCVAVDKAFGEGKLKEFASEPDSPTEEEKKAAKELEDRAAAEEAAKKAAEAEAAKVSQDEEQIGHYFEKVMEKGAKDAKDSPEIIAEELTKAIRQVVK